MSGLNDLLPDVIRYPQEMKCPVCIILDTSGSMSGEPIKLLSDGLVKLKAALLDDSQVKMTVDLCIVTFGDRVTASPFGTAEDFSPYLLSANGTTPMGEAILQGLDLIEQRKTQLRSLHGVHLHRPWVVIMTDGAPTDMKEGDQRWNEVTNKLMQGEKDKKFTAWAFGVPGADFRALNKLLAHQDTASRRVFNLDGYDFKGLFLWLSDSLGQVSRSKEGDKIRIAVPPAIKETMEIEN